MKAIVCDRYGPPDVLALRDLETPTPKDDEVLVKIHAASVNPLDWHVLRADPFFVRFFAGLLKPKTKILGADIAGLVEAVGKNVQQFKPGDPVFGGAGSGGFAEMICCTEEQLELKPTNISFAEGAGVFVAAVSALQGLRDRGELKAGQQVLIYGASGGVGSFAVQIAKAYGAEVTAVCSTQKLEQARSLGADHVIDYTQTDFTQQAQTYDLIFAANGDHPIAAYKKVLKPTGILVVCGGATRPAILALLFGSWLSEKGGKQVRSLMANQNKQDLIVLRELLETGKIKTHIDRTYPLAETAEAVRYVEAGRAKGKVIIEMDQ